MTATSPAIHAPNFDGAYPSAGERIGPAWQVAWETLSSRDAWLASDELSAVMRDHAGIKDATAKNLLRNARKAGLLTVKRRKIRGFHRACYRLIEHGECGA